MSDIGLIESKDNNTSTLYGKRIIGIGTPEGLTRDEFESSVDLVYHGSDKPFVFNPNFDYKNPNFLEQTSGAFNLGSGFYVTSDKTEAAGYSLAHQTKGPETQVYVISLIPRNAVMLDLRERENPTKNGSVPKELFEKWREKYVRYYKERIVDTKGLAAYRDNMETRYLKHLDILANFPDIDLRSMLWTKTDIRIKDGFIPSPPWVELFSDFMQDQGYDGVIYMEGVDMNVRKNIPTYCFYNTEVLDTFEGWQKRKSEIKAPTKKTDTDKDYDRPIESDRFSETISESEKIALLSGAPSFITRAIAETVRSINDPVDKKLILTKIHHFNSDPNNVSGVVKEFLDFVETGNNESLTPFVDNINAHYLSIMCGFIEGVRNLRAGGKINVVETIINNFDTNVEKSLATTPEKPKGKAAAFIIKGRFSDDPTI